MITEEVVTAEEEAALGAAAVIVVAPLPNENAGAVVAEEGAPQKAKDAGASGLTALSAGGPPPKGNDVDEGDGATVSGKGATRDPNDGAFLGGLLELSVFSLSGSAVPNAKVTLLVAAAEPPPTSAFGSVVDDGTEGGKTNKLFSCCTRGTAVDGRISFEGDHSTITKNVFPSPDGITSLKSDKSSSTCAR